ncbi:metallophosphoesterase [Salinibacterium sp. ZJ450]|uniref:metallophosphoesterase n=1 Tax=Salinibacterium sp. ZJ450 TaxID=2708338 RepID=UPI00141FD975|nr:metallophosphoesterase [Salinibacterium sp. ZJ450]
MASSTGGRNAAIASAAVMAVGAGAFAYGSLIERNAFRVRQEFVPVLEPGARPLTVLHLSDMHMAPWQTAKQNWIRSLVRYEPDLIINTGDNLGHAEGLVGLERALEPFQDVPGVFVHGSNDYFGPVMKNPLRYFTGPSKLRQRSASLDTDALERYFEDTLGWLSLNNSARAMTIRGSNLEFFGTNDAHRGWDRLDMLAGAIDEMRENVGWQDDVNTPETVTIGVTHAPYQRVLNSFVTNGADMIFAGHTHGGQVRVPGYGALVTNCDIPHGKAQGLSTWHHARNSAYLNVSAGLGTSIFAPVRFACPPEAVVVTFTASDIGYS